MQLRTGVEFTLLLTLLVPLAAVPPASAAQGAIDSAWRAFSAPIGRQQPSVYWAWQDGNVSLEGITADLEWMQRTGVSGANLYWQDVGVENFVEHPRHFGTPAWREAVKHAISEARRLQLDIGIHAGAGWSLTGGPWVAPHAAMKKYVWSETQVSAESKEPLLLDMPPRVAGPFQDVDRGRYAKPPRESGTLGARSTERPAPPPVEDRFFRDTRVIAFPTPATQRELKDASMQAEAGDSRIDARHLIDGRYGEGIEITPGADGTQLTLDIGNITAVSAVSLGLEHAFGEGVIETSTDGKVWREVVRLPGRGHPFLNIPGHETMNAHVRTFAFAEHPARWLRWRFLAPPPAPTMTDLLSGADRRTAFTVTEFRPRAGAVHRHEDKAGFSVLVDYEAEAGVPSSTVINPTEVLDVTDRLLGNRLDWVPESGDWTVLRLGYSLTGRRNFGGPPNGTGLEVDKLSARHTRDYLEGLFAILQGSDELATLPDSLLFDSWEAGQQNWTESILSVFESQHGYDPTPWLPVLAGYIVDSAAHSDGFLWDWRQTLGELLATGHYQTATAAANERGVTVKAQASGIFQRAIGDGMRLKSVVNTPMGEFWTDPRPLFQNAVVADVREAASTAHVYGRRLVAAEAFTSGLTDIWHEPLAALKPYADRFMAEGVNHLQILCSPHNPEPQPEPGVSCWRLGINYSRGMTWAEHARAFNAYLARSSALLQQGEPVADVAVFLGEGSPRTVPFWQEPLPLQRQGYDYDYIDAWSLLHRAQVHDGRLLLDSGASYPLLVLPPGTSGITLPLLHQLDNFARGGLTIVAPIATGSPSLADTLSPEDLTEYDKLRDALWQAPAKGPGEGADPLIQTLDQSIDRHLHRAGIAPALSLPEADQTRIVWKHRALADGAQLWFIANQSDDALALEPALRGGSLGAAPTAELWFPEDGRRLSASARVAHDGRTLVSMSLAPREAVFVLLHGGTKPTQVAPALRTVGTIIGPWQVTLLQTQGQSEQITLRELGSLHEQEAPAARHFSGLAHYRVVVNLAANQCIDDLVLDLGDVRETARLRVNGETVGEDFIAPYRFNLAPHITTPTRRLELEIEVATSWRNRLLADAALPAAEARSKTVYRPYDPGSALGIALGSDPDTEPVATGLLGPVTLLAPERDNNLTCGNPPVIVEN